MEEKVLDFINEKKLILPHEKIGVAVSGGVDSMSLVCLLNKFKTKLKCEVVAITIDHMLRGEASIGDANFVKTWCKENNVVCHKFSVDAKRIAIDKNMTIEEAAREGRYAIFNKLLNEKVVDKIALAHHVSDQVETILLHIFRGSGLNGAIGMREDRDGKFIRPFLNTSKEEIVEYANNNNIKFVTDETNADSKYARNYLRNIIIPALKKKWEGLDKNIISFAKSCKEDEDFILSHVKTDGIIVENDLAKIPLVYFHYENSIINRIIFDCLRKINAVKDVEKKHIDMIKTVCQFENGKKINLPNNLVAQKEYEYVTIYKKEKKLVDGEYYFKVGKTNFANLYEIVVKETNKPSVQSGVLVVDAEKIPDNAVWRVRKIKDQFTKFGGGTKSLKSFFVDKKISSRIRGYLPVLANGSDILCVANYEISDKVKIDKKTKKAYIISVREVSKI